MESLSLLLFIGVCVIALALCFTNLVDRSSSRLRELDETAVEWERVAMLYRKERDRLRQQQQELRQLLDEIEADTNARLEHGDRT
jgi:exonuclease VII small subunit